MKRIVWSLLTVALLAGSFGCVQNECGRCARGPYSGLANRGGYGGPGNASPAGPPTGAVAYPYYTTRGPRDFLARNPQSIGN